MFISGSNRLIRLDYSYRALDLPSHGVAHRDAHCYVVLHGAHEVGDAVEPGGDELGSVIRGLDGTSEELEPVQERRLGEEVVRVAGLRGRLRDVLQEPPGRRDLLFASHV